MDYMQHFDLADELANSKIICEKVLTDEDYAADLYRALSNMQWRKRELMPLLRNELWSASWRSAGGIVADLRQEGDYLDWYCSGREGTVTEEIRQDLFDLGWEPVEWPDDGV
jgi:hypothetical protein